VLARRCRHALPPIEVSAWRVVHSEWPRASEACRPRVDSATGESLDSEAFMRASPEFAETLRCPGDML